MSAPVRKSARLINASGAATSLAIWVAMRDGPPQRPLAWLCAPLRDQSVASFIWDEAYDYIWADTGQLRAGKTVLAAQRVAVSDQTPAARLTTAEHGYSLLPFVPDGGMPAGTFLIDVADDIPPDRLTVGVNLRIVDGMGRPGNGSVVAQAMPNTRRCWGAGAIYYASFGPIRASEYDPAFATVSPPLVLDFSHGAEVSLLLDGTNTLRQLSPADGVT